MEVQHTTLFTSQLWELTQSLTLGMAGAARRRKSRILAASGRT